MCELCNLVAGNIVTKLYYRNDEFIIVDCMTCHVPMIVFRDHSMFVDLNALGRAFAKILELFGNQVTIKCEQRKVSQHLHWHIMRRNDG